MHCLSHWHRKVWCILEERSWKIKITPPNLPRTMLLMTALPLLLLTLSSHSQGAHRLPLTWATSQQLQPWGRHLKSLKELRWTALSSLEISAQAKSKVVWICNHIHDQSLVDFETAAKVALWEKNIEDCLGRERITYLKKLSHDYLRRLSIENVERRRRSILAKTMA